MGTLALLILGAVIYGVLSDSLDRATERHAQSHRPPGGDLRLVEDFDVRPSWGRVTPRLRSDRKRPPGRDRTERR